MTVKFLDLHAQYLALKTEMDAAIATVIANSSYVGGATVRDFEAAFAIYQQVPHCVGVGNGTDSLEIILENIRRFRAGEALLNQLTLEDIYTRPSGRA